MRNSQNFWDKNAGRYDHFMRKDAAAYERLYELLRPVVRQKTVLELATGTGLIAKHIVRYADHIEALGLKGTACTIHLPDGSQFDCVVPVPGIHMISNALAGASVGYALKLTPEEIKAGIEGLPSIPGRNHIIKTDKIIILDDCYNANPISMKASIDVLDMAIGRKVAVLGDMGELGDDASALHKEVGEYAAKKGIDVVCAIGPVSKALAEGADSGASTEVHWFETKQEFLDTYKDIIRPGDNVLVKASHGMAFPEIVDALQTL